MNPNQTTETRSAWEQRRSVGWTSRWSRDDRRTQQEEHDEVWFPAFTLSFHPSVTFEHFYFLWLEDLLPALFWKSDNDSDMSSGLKAAFHSLFEPFSGSLVAAVNNRVSWCLSDVLLAEPAETNLIDSFLFTPVAEAYYWLLSKICHQQVWPVSLLIHTLLLFQQL